jgi:chromosome segregation ATPase
MNTQPENTNVIVERRDNRWLWAVGASAAMVGGLAVWQTGQVNDLRHQVAADEQTRITLQSKLDQSDAKWQNTIAAMREEFDQARQMSTASVAQLDRTAREKLARQAKEQEALRKKFAQDLDQVRTAGAEAQARIEGITTEVGSVKTEVGDVKTQVASAQSDLSATRNDLQRVVGDMGQMSGLIATNSKQIQYLRDLGDRNIYEFTLAKNSQQKVGDLQIVLKKSDLKKNRFTLEVLADDKRVEKKDRTINEPVQFYTSKAKQPYELVVNTVGKDKVVGYLATPKVQLSRN